MMKRSIIAVLPVAFLAISAACSSQTGTATGSTCPTDSALTYTTFGKAFIETNCFDCHSSNGSESPKLTSVEAIRRASAEIDLEAASGPSATNTAMPQGRSVSDADRKKLGEWLACGAP
jgi:mono/diheme cytochrome c family protein